MGDQELFEELFGKGMTGVALRGSGNGMTARDCALVYLYAVGGREQMPEEAREDVDRALTRLLIAARPELVGVSEVQVEVAGDPEKLLGALRETIEGLGYAVVSESPEPVGKPMACGPDGEPHQDRPLRADARAVILEGRGRVDEVDEERNRYLNLAQTVLDGLRAVFAIAMNEAELRPGDAPREAILREARTMAEAIGEGDLVGKITEALVQYGCHPAQDSSYRFDIAPERLARAILERQLRAGEAATRWEDRTGSRARRVLVAGTILRASELQARAHDVRPGTYGWLAAVGGALVVEHGMGPSQADAIAKHALRVLTGGAETAVPRPDDTGQPDARAPRVEAVSAAETS